MAERLPEDVSAFLRAHVRSVEQLEVLLFLRAERGRVWTHAEVSERLRRNMGSIKARLSALAQDGLLDRAADGYRYVLDGVADREVESVGQCFRSRRGAMIEAIFRADHADGAAGEAR